MRTLRLLGALNLLFGVGYLSCGVFGGTTTPALLQAFTASPLQALLRAELWVGLGANVLTAVGFCIAGIFWWTCKPTARALTLATAAFMLLFVLLDALFALYIWTTYPVSAPTPPLSIAWFALALRGLYPASISLTLLLTSIGQH